MEVAFANNSTCTSYMYYYGVLAGGVIRVRIYAINRLSAPEDVLPMFGQVLLKACTKRVRTFLIWLAAIPDTWESSRG